METLKMSKTPSIQTSPFKHPSQRGLKSRLAQKTLLMVNIAEEDVYFSPLRLWLERKGYFERRNIDLINTHDTQVSVEHLIGGRKYDFLFLRINGAPEAALEFAKMVRELSKETKIILFFAGTKDEFEKSNTNFKDRYDALYDSSKNDIGYPCLRGLLQRAL